MKTKHVMDYQYVEFHYLMTKSDYRYIVIRKLH